MSRKFASAPKIGVSEGLPIDPQYASIIELVKYYRGIGDNAKAAELLKTIPRNVETIPVVPSADQKLDSVSVTRIDQQDEKKNLSLLWDSTDNAVTVSTNHGRHSSMDVRYESTNDSEMYHACEYWSGSTAPAGREAGHLVAEL
jgi:hypothetical protein